MQQSRTHSNPTPQGTGSRNRPTALLAEHDPDVRERLLYELSHEGYEPVPVRGHSEALSWLSKALVQGGELPKLIVLDLKHRSASGLRLLSGARSWPFHPPILVLTDRQDAAKRARELGAAAVLRRDAEGAALRQAIEKMEAAHA